MGENHFAPVPSAVYGGVLLMAGIAYLILQTAIIRHQGPHSKLKVAVGHDIKGKISAVLYAAAILLAFVHQLIADAIYVVRRADVARARPAHRDHIWALSCFQRRVLGYTRPLVAQAFSLNGAQEAA